MQADEFCKRSGSVPGEWVCVEEDEQCGYVPADGTCRDSDNAPKEKYLKLLEFRHFERHILFSQSERKDKKKAISSGVNVQVVVRV